MRAPRSSSARELGWGFAIVLAYLIAASVTLGSGRVLLRPFFEGTAPPPSYRWVNPPKSLKAANRPPDRGEGTAKLGPKGSAQATIGTNDGQALVSLSEGSVKSSPGQTSVKIVLEPIDPRTLGSPPPDLNYDGNAYKITATYEPSGRIVTFAATDCPVGAQPKRCPTLVLRYAFGATKMLRRAANSWVDVSGTSPASQSLQIYADVPSMGTFVAAGPPRPETASPSRAGDYIAIAVAGLAVAAAVIALRSNFVRRRWRRWRKRRTKAAGRVRKAAPPPKRKRPSKTYGKRKR